MLEAGRGAGASQNTPTPPIDSVEALFLQVRLPLATAGRLAGCEGRSGVRGDASGGTNHPEHAASLEAVLDWPDERRLISLPACDPAKARSLMDTTQKRFLSGGSGWRPPLLRTRSARGAPHAHPRRSERRSGAAGNGEAGPGSGGRPVANTSEVERLRQASPMWRR